MAGEFFLGPNKLVPLSLASLIIASIAALRNKIKKDRGGHRHPEGVNADSLRRPRVDSTPPTE